jgi:FKBP-type peptidyl-prolyl cis-trans isomerase
MIMNKIILVLIAVPLLLFSCKEMGAEKKSTVADQKASLQTDTDKLSYAIGISIGKRLKMDNMEINTAIFSQGVTDGLSGQNELLTEQEVKEVILAFQKRKVDEKNKEAEANKKIGEEFIAGKKNEAGVVALESGLLYKVVKQGTGKTPDIKDTVVVNYRGMTVDGKEFDSSYSKEKPATFRVNRVIKGWTEALQLMKEGDKWELYIPSELAYGQRGNRNIAPNSALIFEIELLSIEAKQEPKQEQNAEKKEPTAAAETAPQTSKQ